MLVAAGEAVDAERLESAIEHVGAVDYPGAVREGERARKSLNDDDEGERATCERGRRSARHAVRTVQQDGQFSVALLCARASRCEGRRAWTRSSRSSSSSSSSSGTSDNLLTDRAVERPHGCVRGSRTRCAPSLAAARPTRSPSPLLLAARPRWLSLSPRFKQRARLRRRPFTWREAASRHERRRTRSLVPSPPSSPPDSPSASSRSSSPSSSRRPGLGLPTSHDEVDRRARRAAAATAPTSPRST